MSWYAETDIRAITGGKLMPVLLGIDGYAKAEGNKMQLMRLPLRCHCDAAAMMMHR